MGWRSCNPAELNDGARSTRGLGWLLLLVLLKLRALYEFLNYRELYTNSYESTPERATQN